MPKSPITAFAQRGIHLFVVPIALHTPMHVRPGARDRRVVEMENSTVNVKSKKEKQFQEIACKGECPCAHSNQCICPEDYSPVCGDNGRNYTNACKASCEDQVSCVNGEKYIYVIT